MVGKKADWRDTLSVDPKVDTMAGWWVASSAGTRDNMTVVAKVVHWVDLSVAL